MWPTAASASKLLPKDISANKRKGEDFPLNVYNRDPGQFDALVIGQGFAQTDALEFYLSYRKHLQNAQGRGVKSHLTFHDYLVKAKAAGIVQPSDINSTARGYRMLRHDHKKGDFMVDNCDFMQYGRSFIMIAPDGTVHNGTELRVFCEQHGLNYTNVVRMFSGRLTHVMKWTGRYDDARISTTSDSIA